MTDDIFLLGHKLLGVDFEEDVKELKSMSALGDSSKMRRVSFHLNLGSIVAAGSARLESPWLRAR
jgi:hypothetical protein